MRDYFRKRRARIREGLPPAPKSRRTLHASPNAYVLEPVLPRFVGWSGKACFCGEATMANGFCPSCNVNTVCA